MKKYKVTLYLMVDPTKGDATFPKTYTVMAESEGKAYNKAEEMRENDEPSIRNRSTFNFEVEEVIKIATRIEDTDTKKSSNVKHSSLSYKGS